MSSEQDTILLKDEVESYLAQSFPKDTNYVKKLLCVLTTSPLFTTLRINQDGVNQDCDLSNAALTSLKLELSKQCAMLKWEQFDQFLHPALKDCVIIKNRGPFQLETCSTEIIVDTSCGMAVLRGANIFKQGIMGAPHSLSKEDRVSVYADLDGRCLKGTSALYPGNKRHIGNGISQVTRQELFNSKEIQTGVGILMTEPVYQAPSLSDLDPVMFFPQNLPSIVCGHVLDPKPGEMILDMCAAPGGKTTHIASLMAGKGRVVALEKSGERVLSMKAMLQRIGTHASIIETYVFDSTKAFNDEQDGTGGPPYPTAMFDRIILDAPCSALGQRPCLANKIGYNQIKSYPVIQRKLLAVAVKLLKPGGVLVYSTCTIPVEENEEQVCHVLNTYPDMELVPTGFESRCEVKVNSQLCKEDRKKTLRFDPVVTEAESGSDPWDTDTIGFFIAKFRKKEH